MRLWIDDLRTPPDETWAWAKTSVEAIAILKGNAVEEMSLDHDMGGEGYGAEETTRPIVMWLCEQLFEDGANARLWPPRITIHSWNPMGAEWLKLMCERYSPWQDYVPYIPSDRHWSGVEP